MSESQDGDAVVVATLPVATTDVVDNGAIDKGKQLVGAAAAQPVAETMDVPAQQDEGVLSS